MKVPKLYIIGSLKNARIPHLGNTIRNLGYDVVDTWHGGGPDADLEWQRYESIRERSYLEALYDHYATNIWEYDKYHLDTSDAAVLVMPAGRSAHIEIGYLMGQGKPGYILLEGEPDVFDVMYRFATNVFIEEDDLCIALKDLYVQLQRSEGYISHDD